VRPRGGATGWDALAFDSNTARHELLSCAVFCRKQLTIRLTSGICSLQSRKTSGVQAICCSKVPRYSCAEAGPAAIPQPTDIAKLNKIRCTRMCDPSLGFKGARIFRTANGRQPSK
jgi:hypothetical protein